MSSMVRFSTISDSNNNSSVSKHSNKECQTQPLQFASIGTDPPPPAPERAIQTEARHQITAGIRGIRTELVETLLAELERARREGPLLDAFERQIAIGGNGVSTDSSAKRRITLQHIRQIKIPDELRVLGSPSISLLSLHCGPGSRVALLFGSPRHSSSWCSGHLGAQLALIGTRRRKGQQLISSAPLPACPSTLLFARHGELLIVGAHSGDLLLLSSLGGEMLWSSASVPAMSHARAVTQMRWMDEGGGGGQQKELISLGLDGTVMKSRLQANNQLELVQRVNLSLGDLPRELRKGEADGTGRLGLVDCGLLDQLLLIVSETGIVLEMDWANLRLVATSALCDSAEGVEQIAPMRQVIGPFSSTNDQIVWRTSNGLVRRCPIRQQKLVTAETELLPMERSWGDFQICFNQLLLVIGISDREKDDRHRDLLGWDQHSGAMLRFLEHEEGRVPECIGVSGRQECVVIAVRRDGEMDLELYDICTEH